MAKRGAILVGKDVSVADIEKDIQIGAMIACEWSNADIALHYGLVDSAIAMRKKRYPHSEVIPFVVSSVRLAMGKYVEDRIQRAEHDIKAKKERIHRKGYDMVEKVLDDGLKAEELDPMHLRAAEMGIERTEGKPLDRKAILSRNENVTTKLVNGDELDAILGEMAQINQIRKPLQIEAGIQDAEVV